MPWYILVIWLLLMANALTIKLWLHRVNELNQIIVGKNIQIDNLEFKFQVLMKKVKPYDSDFKLLHDLANILIRSGREVAEQVESRLEKLQTPGWNGEVPANHDWQKQVKVNTDPHE